MSEASPTSPLTKPSRVGYVYWTAASKTTDVSRATLARRMRIHHLAFRTGDLAALERFYADALGLAVLQRHDDRSVWLDAGGTIVMLERREAGEATVPPGSKELVAFTIEPSDGARVASRFQNAGIAIEDRTEYTMYVRDPDGRRVALSSYPDKLTRG